MEIRSILVNLEIDAFSPALVKCASGVTLRFGAELTGFTAAQPSAGLIGLDGTGATSNWHLLERADIEVQLRKLQHNFRAQVPSDIVSNWRAYVDAPNRGLSASAHVADLIVTGSRLGDNVGYGRSADVGELVLTAGRPVMAVGAGVGEIRADKIVVGWKDTREARRALADALPLLKVASEVTVAAISEGDPGLERARLDEVLTWLRRHDVKARGEVYDPGHGNAETLDDVARSFEADLIVAGGYGHSRLREWLFGGITRDLLAHKTSNRFMSN